MECVHRFGIDISQWKRCLLVVWDSELPSVKKNIFWVGVVDRALNTEKLNIKSQWTNIALNGILSNLLNVSRTSEIIGKWKIRFLLRICGMSISGCYLEQWASEIKTKLSKPYINISIVYQSRDTCQPLPRYSQYPLSFLLHLMSYENPLIIRDWRTPPFPCKMFWTIFYR